MRIVNNMSAINAHRYLGINNGKLGKSLEKLSSGYAINRAGDNAAGLAVSEKMRSQIAGLEQGTKNAQDGISMVQTYEGALTEADNILQRMKTLATQAANGTYDTEVDRAAIQLEFDQLNDELDQIADTDFNGVCVLNGGYSADGIKLTANDGVTTTPKVTDLTANDVTITDADKYTGQSGKVKFTFNGTNWVTDANETLQASTDGEFKYKGATIDTSAATVVEGTAITLSFSSAVDAQNMSSKSTTQDVAITADTTADGVNTSTTSGNDVNVTYTYYKDGDNNPAGTTTAGWYNAEGTELAVTTTDSATVDTTIDGIKFTVTNANPTGTPTAGDTLTFKFRSHQDSTVSVVDPENKSSVSDAYTNGVERTSTMTYTDNITLQVGGRSKDAVKFTFAYSSEGLGDLKADLNCTADGLGTSSLTLESQASANAAIDKIDNAINKVSMVRGTFGSIQNRLEHKIDNMNVTNENLTAAESRIRDTDMAAEMMEFTKNQILSQASQSMLAQANQLPQGVLSLLQ